MWEFFSNLIKLIRGVGHWSSKRAEVQRQWTAVACQLCQVLPHDASATGAAALPTPVVSWTMGRLPTTISELFINGSKTIFVKLKLSTLALIQFWSYVISQLRGRRGVGQRVSVSASKSAGVQRQWTAAACRLRHFPRLRWVLPRDASAIALVLPSSQHLLCLVASYPCKPV